MALSANPQPSDSMPNWVMRSAPKRRMRLPQIKVETKPAAEEMPQRAEAAQHRRHQGAHQRPVAIRQSCKIRIGRAVVELLVERPASSQHAVEDLGGDPARGKAGRINGG